MATPPDGGHWHQRGPADKPTTNTWAGWVRHGCIAQPGCDWAIYVNPTKRERVGYIPSANRPVNVTHPDDVTFTTKDRRLVPTARKRPTNTHPEPIGADWG